MGLCSEAQNFLGALWLTFADLPSLALNLSLELGLVAWYQILIKQWMQLKTNKQKTKTCLP